MASGSGWNLWVWLVGVVVRRWVESMGVSSGCGCKEVYRFPHITYPYSSCICSFLQQHPSFFKVGMSKMLHRHNTLQTCEYLKLGTL